MKYIDGHFEGPNSGIRNIIQNHLTKISSDWHDQKLYSWNWSSMGRNYLNPGYVFGIIYQKTENLDGCESLSLQGCQSPMHISKINKYEKVSKSWLGKKKKEFLLEFIITGEDSKYNFNRVVTNMKPDVRLFGKTLCVKVGDFCDDL